MERVRFTTDTIHSDKLQEERVETMKNFRSGDLKVLVATDVSARGIDIPNVEFVINYDLPDTAENYVHRVGRTGRGNQKGQAISFCSAEEKPVLDEIEENLGKPVQRLEISKKDYKLTLEATEDIKYDWQALIDEGEKFVAKKKKKKR